MLSMQSYTPIRDVDSVKVSFSHIENTASLKPYVMPLSAILPSSFADMYVPEVLSDTRHLNELGRPKFTGRALVDWSLNDVRSLLIVSELRPEWNGCIPTVAEPGYRVLLLPLDSTNEQIVETLVKSDVYREHKFDERFLVQTAQYTVEAARRRRLSTSSLTDVMDQDNFQHAPLTKPEWRNIIENYLLNLGCEAQCRLDYKRCCMQLKRQKEAAVHKTESPSLLKKALLTSSSTSPDFPSYLRKAPGKPKPTLTRHEKQVLWVQVQSQLYKRLGLDWEADEIV